MGGMHRSPWPSAVTADAGSAPLIFAADPHLHAGCQGDIAAFTRMIESLPGGFLVLLGDTFHLYWGPEVLAQPCWTPLLGALRSFCGRGRVFFLRGNRDFLVDQELQRRTGVPVAGEVVLFRAAGLLVYACHGDQLLAGDVAYQRMKRVIRSSAAVRFWLALPAPLRRWLARGLRSVTVRSLERKCRSDLVPHRRTLAALFRRGADVVVSGHRHAAGAAVHAVGARSCLHHEVPAWCDARQVLVFEAGTRQFALCRMPEE